MRRHCNTQLAVKPVIDLRHEQPGVRWLGNLPCSHSCSCGRGSRIVSLFVSPSFCCPRSASQANDLKVRQTSRRVAETETNHAWAQTRLDGENCGGQRRELCVCAYGLGARVVLTQCLASSLALQLCPAGSTMAALLPVSPLHAHTLALGILTHAYVRHTIPNRALHQRRVRAQHTTLAENVGGSPAAAAAAHAQTPIKPLGTHVFDDAVSPIPDSSFFSDASSPPPATPHAVQLNLGLNLGVAAPLQSAPDGVAHEDEWAPFPKKSYQKLGLLLQRAIQVRRGSQQDVLRHGVDTIHYGSDRTPSALLSPLSEWLHLRPRTLHILTNACSECIVG